MKTKIAGLLLITTMIFSFSSCSKKGCTDVNSFAYSGEKVKKDDGSCTYPTSIKKALVFKLTATWCHACGSYGKETTEQILNDHSNAMVIQINGSDEFSSDVGDEIKDLLSGSSYPSFYSGLTIVNGGPNTISNTVDDELAESVEVSMAMEKQTLGAGMNIKVQSEWIGTPSGEYHLAVYILEDNIVMPQIVTDLGDVTDFVHKHVLRAEASNAGFGKVIVPTDNDGHMGHIEEFGVALQSTWVPANCYPVAVMWKKNGTTYDFVNFVM